LYHPSELGLEVTRICVGSSDYAASMYSYDEGDPDPELQRFSIDHDKQYILPQLRIARKHDPDLYVLASPWSPPGWMKANGSMLGGSLKPRNFPGVRQVSDEVPAELPSRGRSGRRNHPSE
jgi:glucosylceramidase